MDKNSLILKYFQKDSLLKVTNVTYSSSISDLFRWLVNNDEAKKDITSKSLHLDTFTRTKIIAIKNTVMAGLEEISYLLKISSGLSFEPLTKDGDEVKAGQTVARLSGIGSEILGLERTVLNILQRMSGIATSTHEYVMLVKPGNPYVAATRKTPYMSLDKKAVILGGGITHRLSLRDGILVKDNHINILRNKFRLDKKDCMTGVVQEICGSVVKMLIEIETENEEEVFQTIEAFQKYNKNNYLSIMFDNFLPERVEKVLREVRKRYPDNLTIFEGSGGVNKDNLKKWEKSRVDIVSVGALTHSFEAANLSLEVE